MRPDWTERRRHRTLRAFDLLRVATLIARALLLVGAASLMAIFSPAHVAAIYDPFTIENARASGMGRVTAIAADGTIATWWNPAFLAFLAAPSAAVSNSDFSIFLPDGYIRSATWSGPLPWASRRFGMGLGLKRADYGKVLLASSSTLEDKFHLWDQAYVTSVGYRANESVALGFSLEYLWSHKDGPPSASFGGSDGALSTSFAVAYRHPIRFEVLGANVTDSSSVVVTPLAAATLLHVGQKLGPGEGYDLPRQLRVAGGVQVERTLPAGTPAFAAERIGQFAIVAAIEAYVPATEWELISTRSMIVHFGTELTLFGILSGRLGFIDNNEYVGPSDHVNWDNTYGFGIALPEGFPATLRFDWAAAPWGQSERIYRRTFSVALRP